MEEFSYVEENLAFLTFREFFTLVKEEYYLVEEIDAFEDAEVLLVEDVGLLD